MAMATCRLLAPTPTKLAVLLESALLDVVLVEIKAITVEVVVVVDDDPIRVTEDDVTIFVDRDFLLLSFFSF